MLAFGAALCLLAGSCSHPSSSASHIADPPASVPAKPDYTQSCSPSGADASVECAQVVLQSIDNARAKEHVGPMVLPSNFGKLSVPQQLFVALNRERVDRRLPPITGLSDGLSALAERGASTGKLPPDPGSGYSNADTEWIGAVVNALDAVYQWMYERGSAWADRHAVLDDFGSAGTVVMGASFSPTGDTDPTDKGGTSLAAVVAVAATPGTLAYAWTQAQADLAAGTLRPRGALPTNASATHIADPPQTVPANPDFTEACAPSGLDSSAACIQSALEAVDNARAAEGVKAMVLPAGFASLTVPQQLFVAVNLERVDRGLPPFAGLTAALTANAQRGADIANDPPDPGKDYDVVDTEWAGGSSNGLDAVYGWM
ncbi:MAG: hypothetical protein JWM17_382, partial [Actinobacteria bacterium]|nr:hypothetical protein [Actinomycetota bacterium]